MKKIAVGPSLMKKNGKYSRNIPFLQLIKIYEL